MKYKAIIIIAVLFVSFKISAQIDRNIRVTVNDKGKYGITMDHPDYLYGGMDSIAVEHKFDTIIGGAYFSDKTINFVMYNYPLITRIGDKYGIIMHYKVGITDHYRDSFAVLPAIYDTAYHAGILILRRGKKWGYLDMRESDDIGYTSFGVYSPLFYDPFFGSFYLSPIEYDLPPQRLLRKNGKYGFRGYGEKNIPCEYDTLIYWLSANTTRYDNTIRGPYFRWPTGVHVKGFPGWNSNIFVKAVKNNKVSFFLVHEKENTTDTFFYRRVLPWYSDSVDIRMAWNEPDPYHTLSRSACFIITEPGKSSYFIWPYDDNFDQIKMLNLDGSPFTMDSTIKYYNYAIDSLGIMTETGLWLHAKKELSLYSSFYGYARSSWDYFNDCIYSYQPTVYDIDKHIYIVKQRDTNIAYIFRHINKIFGVPYNPCGTNLRMICTKELNVNKDSVIFTLYNSQTIDTIYQGIFPYNDTLRTSQLYLQYNLSIYDYQDYAQLYHEDKVCKEFIDNGGLELDLYYIPADKYAEIHTAYYARISDMKYRQYKKKYYYKLGTINTCEMKFHPYAFKFLHKKPWLFDGLYEYNYPCDETPESVKWEEYDVKP